MPAKKKPKPSLEACQKLWALIVTAKDLSPEIEAELLDLVYAIWPGRPRSVLQEWAYPEIHRLMNGVAIWQVPLGKRFGIVAASKMIAKIIEASFLEGAAHWLSQVEEQAHAAGAARDLRRGGGATTQAAQAGRAGAQSVGACNLGTPKFTYRALSVTRSH